MTRPVPDAGLSRLWRAAGRIVPIAGAAMIAIVAAAALWQGASHSSAIPGDEYVLLQGGRDSTLPGPIGATPAAAGYFGETEGRDFAESLRLGPPKPRIGTVGYEITGRTDRELLVRFGLQPGDVLVSIDNLPLDPNRMAGLGNELAALDKVEIAYERGGVIEDRLVKFQRR
ncbi:hypothetical protein [Croceicoccus sediminis]|uniref:hypothetical protein n=1 Tax=Croceicoccus sediminis TaxID=2571150 RepID=UPI0011844661|nr:hypothetical protein [Croceicoccus sediminis]